jgi:hypothetical protein
MVVVVVVTTMAVAVVVESKINIFCAKNVC